MKPFAIIAYLISFTLALPHAPEGSSVSTKQRVNSVSAIPEELENLNPFDTLDDEEDEVRKARKIDREEEEGSNLKIIYYAIDKLEAQIQQAMFERNPSQETLSQNIDAVKKRLERSQFLRYYINKYPELYRKRPPTTTAYRPPIAYRPYRPMAAARGYVPRF
jgi:hypothetical protein